MPSSSSLSLKEQGATAFRAGRWEEAIDFYSQALKGVDEVQEEEEAGSLYCSRAEARIHAYQFDLALLDAATASALRPIWSSSHARRAEAYAHLGRDDLALSSYNRAMDLAETDEDPTTYSRYQTARALVLSRAEALSNPSAALISQLEASDFYARYEELSQAEKEGARSAELAVLAYEVIDKAMEELDEEMQMSEEGTVEAMSPSPVLTIADGILTDPRGFHIPPGKDEKCPLAEKLTIQLACDFRVLGLNKYLGGALTTEEVLDDFDAMVEKEGGWSLARLSLAALVRGSFVSAFLSEVQGNTALAISKYRFTHSIIQAARKRWPTIPDDERGNSFSFTFARGVKVHLLLALEEAYFKVMAPEREKQGADNLAEIQNLAEEIMDDCVAHRLPAEPAVMHLAYQIHPISHAGKAIGFVLGQRSRSPEMAAKAGPALYHHPSLAAAAAKMCAFERGNWVAHYWLTIRRARGHLGGVDATRGRS